MNTVIQDAPVIARGQTWRNKKLRTTYEIMAVAICCDNDRNNQPSIIYTNSEGLFTRCRDEFLQKFEQVEKR